MAKLNAPLFSFNASGKLANALVYFGWKGLDLVRSYVVPSNPKTSLQTTQRGYFSAAVAAIHAARALAANELAQEDATAYSTLGTTRATPRTWFNEIVKLWADAKVASVVPVIYHGWNIPSTVNDSITINLYISEETGSELAAGKCYFGASKTALIHSQAVDVAPGDHVEIAAKDLSAFITAGNKYFVQFRPDSGDPCEGADSGIYSFIAT